MHDTTRSLVRRSAVGLALLALLAAPAGAQDHRRAMPRGGGWSQPSDMVPDLPGTLTLEPGWVASAQLETWSGSGRVGWRLGGSMMDRALEEDANSQYLTLSADLALLIRLLPAGNLRWVAPYVALGAGATMYRGRDGTGPFGFGLYGDDPVIRPMATAGGGFELLPSRRFGLRIEAVDRMVFPGVGGSLTDADFTPSHGPQVTASLQLRGGRINPAPRVVAAAPAPAEPAVRVAENRASSARAESRPTPSEAAELRARVDDTQGRLMVLTRRVDSLESAVGEVHLAAAEAMSAASAASAVAAAAPKAAPATPAPAPVKPGTPLFTVQVGAFVEEATARTWEQRLRARSLPVFVTAAVVRGQRVSRVRIGALPSSGEADELARLLNARYGWPVWVDRVAEETAVPADAVNATRSFLRSN